MAPNKMAAVLSLVVISMVLTVINSVKILMIPANINSHIIYFSRLGESLAELGHHTHILVASNAKLPTSGHENFTVAAYPVEGDISMTSSPKMSSVLIEAALAISVLEKGRLMIPFQAKLLASFTDDCHSLLNNEKLIGWLRKEHFEFVVMDMAYTNCYVLPYSLGVPYATLSVAIPLIYRVPRLPSFSSTLGYSDKMTFFERLKSAAHVVLLYQFLLATPSPPPKSFVVGKPLFGNIELIQKSSLWFYLEDLALAFPRPLMPNTIRVGDIMAQPAKELDKELKKLLDDSPNGVIIISFGSFFDYVPDEVAEKFCDAFRQMKQTIIWKMKNFNVCRDVSRVRILSWIPQNDLLAHKHVQLFITHGGYNGLIEAVYHSKPVIVFPIALDQPENAGVIAAKHLGIPMDLANFTVTDLVSNVNRVLMEDIFKRQVTLASAILKDKTDTAAESASAMIEHVIKYGDTHLRTGAFELSILQFLMFDIYLFITVLLVLLVVCIILIVCCFIKFFKRRCRRNKVKRE